ncbi:MAG: hypothetical protein AAF993_04410 [Pseudomonadota bacterium]
MLRHPLDQKILLLSLVFASLIGLLFWQAPKAQSPEQTSPDVVTTHTIADSIADSIADPIAPAGKQSTNSDERS